MKKPRSKKPKKVRVRKVRLSRGHVARVLVPEGHHPVVVHDPEAGHVDIAPVPLEKKRDKNWWETLFG
jgi:hypothetical protein